MKRSILGIFMLASAIGFVSCDKTGTGTNDMVYFAVGFKDAVLDWRDNAFIVATSNPQLIQQASAQLSRPVSERQIVFGKLQAGSGGYNHNASHVFKWHLKEDDWSLVDMTAEIYDGRPYSDADSDTAYRLNIMRRYGSWNSYIKRKLEAKP